MKKTFSKPYDWNVICQVCREKIKASRAVRRWDGLIVAQDHPGCFEYRSPLEMPAPKLQEQRPLPFTSPETPDEFVTGLCPVTGHFAVPEYAVPGCVIPGLPLDQSYIFDPLNNLYPG